MATAGDSTWISTETVSSTPFIRLNDDRGITHLINIDQITKVTEYVDEANNNAKTVEISLANSKHSICINMNMDEFQKMLEGK